MSQVERATAIGSLRSFWPFLRHQKRRFVVLTSTSLVGGLVEALTLVLITNLALSLGGSVGGISLKAAGLQLEISPGVAFGAAVFAIALRTALGVWNGWSSAELSTGAAAQLREELNAAYLQAEWSYQARLAEGHLQDLLGPYAVQVSGGLGALTNFVVAAASLLMMVVSALFVSPVAALTLGVGAAFLSITQRPLRAATRRRSKLFNQANTELGLSVTESAQLMQEIRTFGVRDAVASHLSALVDSARRAGRRLLLLSSVSLYSYQGAALILVVAALGVIYLLGASNVTALATVVLILVRSLSYAQQVQTSLQSLQSYAPAADRVHEQLDELEAYASPSGTRAVNRVGDLHLNDVSYRYEGGRMALDHVTATIPAGEAVGLVGPSGAGKSTLVQLLLRLRRPTSGDFTVDGVDASEIRLEDYHRRVAFVPQDNRLFDGSVAANIAFYREATAQQIEHAARLAHIHDEIMSWADGYETHVGVRGGAVSGGQRQRLCLARALLTEPDVLVLDEPTSALDLRSEELVHQTLEELRGRVTIIIVAHRLSTLRVCDRIMVLGKGKLEAFAPADQLEAENPFFAQSMALTTVDRKTGPTAIDGTPASPSAS